MYHIVCPAKYRRAVITEEVDKKLYEKIYESKQLELFT
jgi:REP element-mobilizing transposase RayT